MSDHDVIIVGGRVAGAATAMLLAREGLDVVVLERARRGSDTLSTHALMRPAVELLARWGLLADVVAAGTPAQDRVVFHYGQDRVELDLSQPLYAPRRTVIDPILVAAAEEAGARFRFGVRATGLVTDGSGRVVGVHTRRGARRHTLTGRITIGADGRNSVVAGQVNATTTVQGRSSAAAMCGYWSGVVARGYEWGYAPGTTAGLIPTNDGLVCVYAGVPRDRFLGDLRHDLDGGILRVLEQTSPSLAGRVAAGHRHGPVRGFPGHPGWLRRPWGPGWALVGDAGYFKDPITAHGMTDALRDADLLARDVLALLGGGPDDRAVAGPDGAIVGAYESVRDDLSLPFFEVTEAIASFAWTMDEVQRLHLRMSAAMARESEALAALAASPASPASPASRTSPRPSRHLPAA